MPVPRFFSYLEVNSMNKNLEKALSLARHLKQRGFDTVIVGGAVRDLWLGLPLRDIDLATQASVETLFALFPGGNLLGHPPHATFLIPWRGSTFETVTWHGETMEADLARRDFTINAMALDTRGRTLDPFKGRQDLAAGKLRFNGNATQRLREDPVRGLRIGRFASTLPNFRIVPEDLDTVRTTVPSLFSEIPHERIGNEVLKALTGDLNFFLEFLKRTGLLHQIVPEISALNGIRQNPELHPEGNALIHTMLTVEKASRLTYDPAVRAAALFHDVGKAPCLSANGSFRRHEAVGADLARHRMRLWAWPTHLRNTVSELVHRHMIPILSSASQSLLRLAHHRGRTFVEQLFQLSLADLQASGSSSDHWRNNRDAFLEGHIRLGQCPLPLNGRQVMEILDLPPGPAVGKALEMLETALINGQIHDAEGARKLLQKHDPGKFTGRTCPR